MCISYNVYMDEERSKLIKIGIIIAFIVIMIMLIVVYISTNLNRNNENNRIDITENVEESVVVERNLELDDSKLVKDYKTFYTVQNAINNYINALIEENYEKTYSILSQELKSKYDKTSYIETIAEYKSNNFVSSERNMYDTVDNLQNVYLIDDNTYVGELKNINNEIIKIGVILNYSTKTYQVFYLEI